MAAYKRFSPTIWSAFSFVLLIVIWLAFAPTQVGGMASYIIVIGKSMEPNFHIGDVIIVHEQSVYQVGDAIVYRNLETKSFVFHRILSQQLGRYTLQGDNNSWVDTYRPSRDEVIGKLWLYIPGGGKAIQKIRSPFAIAVISGALGALLAIRLSRNKAGANKSMSNRSFQEWFTSFRQRIQARFKTTNSSEPNQPLGLNQGEILEGSFFALGAIAFSSLILAIITFSRPASRSVQDDLSYQHLGIFSYSASVPQGVYDTNNIKSGDPIFTKLTCSVDVNFQYTLIAAQAEGITGTYQLTAIISEQVSGWKRVIPLQEEATFTGTTFGTSARIDLCKIGSLTQSLEQSTDFHPGTYTLMITPNVKLAGTLSNRALEGAFNSGPMFQYDRVQFYLVRTEEQKNPLVLTEAGILKETYAEANTLLLIGRELSIPTLRWVALLSLIVSVSGLILLSVRLQTLARLDQENFFRIKYGSMMVDIRDANTLTSSKTIDVASLDALAKLAERFGALILHSVTNHQHTYCVQFGEVTYRFLLDASKTEANLPEEETVSGKGEA